MNMAESLPVGLADFPRRWRAIKIAFSKTVPTGDLDHW